MLSGSNYLQQQQIKSRLFWLAGWSRDLTRYETQNSDSLINVQTPHFCDLFSVRIAGILSFVVTFINRE
jgi:hypothetical protein